MKERQYDIFLSYRRRGGWETAKHLSDLLTRDGYSVSFDVDTLRDGRFDTQLLTRIEGCKDFILIVDKNCFDRTLDPEMDPKDDWLRCELACALKNDIHIIPVFLSGTGTFPAGLPDDIKDVVFSNGIPHDMYYFDAYYEKLKSFLNSVPRSDEASLSGRHKLLKHAAVVATVAVVLVCVLLVSLWSAYSRKNIMSEFEGIVSRADSIVRVEQEKITIEKDVITFDVSNISQAKGLYIQALEMDVRNDSLRKYVNDRSQIMSALVDSCYLYGKYDKTIQMLVIEERIPSAEVYRRRQKVLAVRINSILGEI